MEDGRAHADKSGCEQDGGERGGHREQDQAGEGDGHADRERERFGVAIGIEADDRLQEGCGDLECQSDESDLPEIEMEGLLEHRIDGGQQRLHQVVQEMADADGGQDGEDGFGGLLRRGKGGSGKQLSG